MSKWRSPVDPVDRRRFAPWVRDLKLENGVYAIRSTSTRELLYVGESHNRRLYDTLTRHAQYWAGYNAGPSYDRDQVEVKVHITRVHAKRCPLTRVGGRSCTCGAAQAAIDLQDAWIVRLRPTDNRVVPKFGGDLEDVPF